MSIVVKRAPARGAGLLISLIVFGSMTLTEQQLGAVAAVRSGTERAVLWTGLSVPHPGISSLLLGASCSAPARCWAVGSYVPRSGVRLNQALRWNGRKWSKVSTPNPGGTIKGAVNLLVGVACALPADCWAVGFYVKNGAGLNQALRWNGRKWSLVATPSPGGTARGNISSLDAVRCTSSVSCWAVGSYRSPSGLTLNQILHWNGRRWASFPVPDPGGDTGGDVNELISIRCTSSANCWAVGTYAKSATGVNVNQALRWNGRRWSPVTTPNPGGTADGDFTELLGVTCESSSNCWAVGDYGSTSTNTRLNQALRWNGRKWSLVATPDPDGTGAGAMNTLTDVACTSPLRCWAVGGYGNAGGGIGVGVNQVLRWNGRKWSPTATPNPAGLANGDFNFLNNIRCPSRKSCWAVGFAARKGALVINQILHWNGSRWFSG